MNKYTIKKKYPIGSIIIFFDEHDGKEHRLRIKNHTPMEHNGFSRRDIERYGGWWINVKDLTQYCGICGVTINDGGIKEVIKNEPVFGKKTV